MTTTITQLNMDPPISPCALPVAYLIPINSYATQAVMRAQKSCSDYHARFFLYAAFGAQIHVPCFELTLGNLPEHADVGWRLGTGRTGEQNLGVDLIVELEEDLVADNHVLFGWGQQRSGLRIMNLSDSRCTINHVAVSSMGQEIPRENVINVGQCVFTVVFHERSQAVEEVFQEELWEIVQLLRQMGQQDDKETDMIDDLSETK